MNTKSLQPFLCGPLLVPKIWGGDKLGTKFGKPVRQPNIGESWEVADLDEGQSHVASGEHAGKSLSEMVEIFGQDLIGTATGLQRFPLLIKFLDANDDLSVQVHPGKDNAALFEGALSKDECWIILDSDGEGEISHGLRPNTTKDDLRDAITDQQCEYLLNSFVVKEGDAIRVPPGTIHAIRKGVALLEIQEPSDTTFRVYDYGRKNEKGERRDLHVDQALKVLNVDAPSHLLTLENGIHSVLFEATNYCVEILNVQNASWSVSPESVQVLINLGANDVKIGELDIAPFQSAIIPAKVNSITISSEGKNRIVLAGVCGRLAKDLRS